MGNCQSDDAYEGDDCNSDESQLLVGTLLGELGIKSLLDRPDGRDLQCMWQTIAIKESTNNSEHHDELVHGTFLSANACSDFLQALSTKYGDGLWKNKWDCKTTSDNAQARRSTLRDRFRSSTLMKMFSESRRNLFSASIVSQNETHQLPVSTELLSSQKIRFEDVRRKIWDEPQIRNITPSTILYIQNKFLQKIQQRHSDGEQSDDTNELNIIEAVDLSNEILDDLGSMLPPRIRKMVTVQIKAKTRTIARRWDSSSVNFITFLMIVGKVYERYSPTHDDGLYWRYNKKAAKQYILPAKVDAIRSFAPPRANTQAEILICGEAVLTAMLNTIKSARVEIMISFWEFCLTLPAIRNAELGNTAWFDPDIDIEEKANADEAIARSRTLLPIIKTKALIGVKTYIILNDVTIAWPLVDYAVKVLSSIDNVYIIRHPDWTVFTDTHHQKFVVADRNIAVLGGVDWTVARWDTPNHPLFDPDAALHPGLELAVNGKRFKKNLSEYWESPQNDLTQDRGETTSSLWQDIAVCVRGEAAADVANNFVERWQHSRAYALKTVYHFKDPLLKSGRPSPKMPNIPSKLTGGCNEAEVDVSKAPTPLSIGGFPSANAAVSCTCQVVRSLASWSGTDGRVDISHYEAWIYAINRAEEYIYIEQQYFVASMGVSSCRNRVAEAILDRVQWAIEQSKPFRVYVVIPATVYMTMVNHFTRRTLLQDGKTAWQRYRRKEKSLMTRIQLLIKRAKPGSYWDGKLASDLLSVCFLASVGKSSSGRWDVGEIFVHSKVLIVDDKMAVIGSANVNDRSFVGSSDSEIGVLLREDKMNASEPGKLGLIRDFRLRLFRQYLGLSLDGQDDSGLISNPESEETFNLWHSTAINNQSIISSVFSHFPSNDITSYGSYSARKKEYNTMSYKEREASLNNPDRLEKVKGLVNQYPPNFMGDDGKRTFLHALLEELPLRYTL